MMMLMDTLITAVIVGALLIVPTMIAVNAKLITQGFRAMSAMARATYNCVVWWRIWYREERDKLMAWEREAGR